MLYLGKENRCSHAICHGSVAIHSRSIHKLLNEYLTELPAILDSFLLATPTLQALLKGWNVGGSREP